MLFWIFSITAQQLMWYCSNTTYIYDRTWPVQLVCVSSSTEKSKENVQCHIFHFYVVNLMKNTVEIQTNVNKCLVHLVGKLNCNISSWNREILLSGKDQDDWGSCSEWCLLSNSYNIYWNKTRVGEQNTITSMKNKINWLFMQESTEADVWGSNSD